MRPGSGFSPGRASVTVLPSSFNFHASLADVVVFPEPFTPIIAITVGFDAASVVRGAVPQLRPLVGADLPIAHHVRVAPVPLAVLEPP